MDWSLWTLTTLHCSWPPQNFVLCRQQPPCHLATRMRALRVYATTCLPLSPTPPLVCLCLCVCVLLQLHGRMGGSVLNFGEDVDLVEVNLKVTQAKAHTPSLLRGVCRLRELQRLRRKFVPIQSQLWSYAAQICNEETSPRAWPSIPVSSTPLPPSLLPQLKDRETPEERGRVRHVRQAWRAR